jgi:Flp pilus assembly protein TadG
MKPCHNVPRRYRRRGALLVEAALVLFLLITLSMGVMEYGWLYYKASQTNMAARHGARIAALVDKTGADAQAAIDAIMANAGITSYTVEISPADVTSLESGDLLTVTVTAPYAGALAVVNAPFIPIPDELRVSVTMAKEGVTYEHGEVQ